MTRGLLAVLLVASGASAQEPPRFNWQPGQPLTYSVRQTTTVTETTRDDASGGPVVAVTVTKLAVTRRWEVDAVEPSGAATLRMTVVAMKQQIARPGARDKSGNPTVIETVLDSATEEGKQAMAAFLGKPIVTVKLDPRGRLLDVTAEGGSADRVRAELPFRLVLPDGRPSVGAVWDRAFDIKLNPPLGTGEAYPATQTYTLKGERDGYLVVGVGTALKAAPKDPGELPPLVPLLWEGDVYFHPATGRYAGARLSVKREVKNHQGEGTKFEYESKYEEGLAGQ
jgi:hypothetical protein